MLLHVIIKIHFLFLTTTHCPACMYFLRFATLSLINCSIFVDNVSFLLIVQFTGWNERSRAVFENKANQIFSPVR